MAQGDTGGRLYRVRGRGAAPDHLGELALMANAVRRRQGPEALRRHARLLHACMAERWSAGKVRLPADHVGFLYVLVLGYPVPVFDMHTVWGEDSAQEERLVYEADRAMVRAGVSQYVRRARIPWEMEHFGGLVLVSKSGRGGAVITGVHLT
jgi:hypothetical protein